MYEPGGAPRHWTVPTQRDAPPATIHLTPPAPATAARDGHHDWGAVVAVLAALIALAALFGQGAPVTDADRHAPRESTVSTR